MKIRWILKSKDTGGFHKKIYSLKQIEESRLSGLFDVGSYNIIGRDLYVGYDDINGVPIFGKDAIEVKDSVNGSRGNYILYPHERGIVYYEEYRWRMPGWCHGTVDTWYGEPCEIIGNAYEDTIGSRYDDEEGLLNTRHLDKLDSSSI